MKIAMVGSGYVGLVSRACFADFRIYAVCIKKDPAKIDEPRDGITPIYEPGLDALADIRNINQPEDVRARGFSYVSIERE